MTGVTRDSLPLALAREIDRVCDEFENALKTGSRPRIEDFLSKVAAIGRAVLLAELISTELDFLRNTGAAADPAAYRERFPEYRELVVEAFAAHAVDAPRDASATTCTFGTDGSVADVALSSNSQAAEDRSIPDRIGRYEIRGVLGRGAFGHVYLAYDPELDRAVALKVPRTDRFSSSAAIDGFLEEARTAARLDHPGIVKVHDVTRDTGSVVVVMEYVEGRTLKETIASGRLTPLQVAGLLSDIADAVNYANEKGLIHRDLKPANILIDTHDRPRVADFGLAIHEDAQRLRKGERAGSPAYMAPEQVRGETHRLDGRTDQWSLGVILYEMLTRRRPFLGETTSDVFDEIGRRDPKPPRQFDSSLSPELERICLKCLSRRMSDRYQTVADLAADLRHWQSTPTVAGAGPTGSPGPAITGASQSLQPRPHDGERETRPAIIPKGLRSFDRHDTDFFLQLLPGPRDRDGLPDSIRFWKTRFEERDADQTFPVGLIYGPSGCGKTSLVQAGLLPRLGAHVCPVRVEASAGDTEVRLLKALRKTFPGIPPDLSLPEIFAGLREGHWIAWDTKLLVVLDQFEQWLHARQGDPKSQLVDALRHCDGGRVQCLVMVRDDFWMAVSRFLDELEVGLKKGENVGSVEPFDPRHARRVLAAFGRAHSALPEQSEDMSPEQTRFLDQAVDGLAENGKIICVRLALFAEMMKGRPWTPASLADVGGTEGIGMTFLEETFSSQTANPKHRQHQKATRAVLKVLLPERGTDIKGNMRSQEELLAASGYAQRPRDFHELLNILDGELRLITPTDPDGVETDNGDPNASASKPTPTQPSTLNSQPSTLHYQLTHDYLEHSVRDWLTRKQRETHRGRAELKLAERTALWKTRRERKQLPTFWEWLTIWLFTKKRQWTKIQRTMMDKAGQVRLIHFSLIVVCLLIWTSPWIAKSLQPDNEERTAKLLVNQLRNAKTEKVPGIVVEMEPYRDLIKPMLQDGLHQAEKDSKEGLHFRLALVKYGDRQVDPLIERLLNAKPNEVVTIASMLIGHRKPLKETLWKVLENPGRGNQLLPAAAGLAIYEPPSAFQDDVSQRVVEQLVTQNLKSAIAWAERLRPLRDKLRARLSEISKGEDDHRRIVAKVILETVFDDLAQPVDEKKGSRRVPKSP